MYRIKLIALFFYSITFAEDTLYFESKEVEVQARKLNKFHRYYTSPNNILINSSEIEQSSSGISEVLNKKSGLYIRDYGGFGGLKSVSLRGNTSSQTAILYNGFKLNSAQNSMFDLSNVSNNISSISVNKSGASTLVGGNASGGSINLLTGMGNSGFKVQSEIASFDTKSISLFYKDNSKDKFSYQLNGSYRNSMGDYPTDFFDGDQTKTIKRQNSQSEYISASANINYSSSLYFAEAEIGNWYNYREIPGPLVSGRLNNSSANLSENTFYIFNKFHGEDFDFGLWFNSNQRNFEDKLNGSQNFGFDNSRYNTNEFQYHLNYYWHNKNFGLILRNDFTFTALRGNMADPNAENSYSRLQSGTSLISSYSLNNLNFNAGLRYDYYSDTEDFISYSFQTNYELDSIEFDLNLSSNFRPPSFNELYYLNFGNLNLKPETSTNIDLGTSMKSKFIDVIVSIFYSNIEDQIIAVPLSPILWSSQNADETLNYGFEAAINFEYSFFEVIANYTRQVSQDSKTSLQVPYTPEEVFFSELNFNLKHITLSFNGYYSSFRYILRNNKSEFLENYFILNTRFSYKFSNSLQMTLFANNILNKDYEIINNFPMPGINFNLRGELKL